MFNNPKAEKFIPGGRGSTAILVVATVIAGLIFISWHVRVNFWLELFISYLPQLVIINMALLLAIATFIIYRGVKLGWHSLLDRERKVNIMTIVIVALSVHNFVMPFTTVTAESTDDSVSPTLSAMTINKLYDNSELTQLVNYADLIKPDILGIQETYEMEAEELATSLGYTYWHMADCGCSAYGSDLAIFSRFPILNTALAFEDRLGGVLRSEIEIGHKTTVTVFVTHIVPAYGSLAFEIRQQMLGELANLIILEKNPVVLMGDFNASIHSIDMRTFSAKVSNSILPVVDKPWPKCSWFLISELFCARIDHVYIPNDSKVIDESIGPYIGSDHRPVMVEFSY